MTLCRLAVWVGLVVHELPLQALLLKAPLLWQLA